MNAIVATRNTVKEVKQTLRPVTNEPVYEIPQNREELGQLLDTLPQQKAASSIANAKALFDNKRKKLLMQRTYDHFHPMQRAQLLMAANVANPPANLSFEQLTPDMKAAVCNGLQALHEITKTFERAVGHPAMLQPEDFC